MRRSLPWILAAVAVLLIAWKYMRGGQGGAVSPSKQTAKGGMVQGILSVATTYHKEISGAIGALTRYVNKPPAAAIPNVPPPPSEWNTLGDDPEAYG